MDASSLSHRSETAFDSVIFYQSDNGVNPIEDKEYNAQMDDEVRTCAPLGRKISQCSIRVVAGRPEAQVPQRHPAPGGSGRNIIDKKRMAPRAAPKALVPNDCWSPDVVHYTMPSGEQETSNVPPQRLQEVIQMLDEEDWTAVERFRVSPEAHAEHDDRWWGSEDDASTQVGSGSDGGQSIGSGRDQ